MEENQFLKELYNKLGGDPEKYSEFENSMINDESFRKGLYDKLGGDPDKYDKFESSFISAKTKNEIDSIEMKPENLPEQLVGVDDLSPNGYKELAQGMVDQGVGVLDYAGEIYAGQLNPNGEITNIYEEDGNWYADYEVNEVRFGLRGIEGAGRTKERLHLGPDQEFVNRYNEMSPDQRLEAYKEDPEFKNKVWKASAAEYNAKYGITTQKEFETLVEQRTDDYKTVAKIANAQIDKTREKLEAENTVILEQYGEDIYNSIAELDEELNDLSVKKAILKDRKDDTTEVDAEIKAISERYGQMLSQQVLDPETGNYTILAKSSAIQRKFQLENQLQEQSLWLNTAYDRSDEKRIQERAELLRASTEQMTDDRGWLYRVNQSLVKSLGGAFPWKKEKAGDEEIYIYGSVAAGLVGAFGGMMQSLTRTPTQPDGAEWAKDITDWAAEQHTYSQNIQGKSDQGPIRRNEIDLNNGLIAVLDDDNNILSIESQSHNNVEAELDELEIFNIEREVRDKVKDPENIKKRGSWGRAGRTVRDTFIEMLPQIVATRGASLAGTGFASYVGKKAVTNALKKSIAKGAVSASVFTTTLGPNYLDGLSAGLSSEEAYRMALENSFIEATLASLIGGMETRIGLGKARISLPKRTEIRQALIAMAKGEPESYLKMISAFKGIKGFTEEIGGEVIEENLTGILQGYNNARYDIGSGRYTIDDIFETTVATIGATAIMSGFTLPGQISRNMFDGTNEFDYRLARAIVESDQDLLTIAESIAAKQKISKEKVSKTVTGLAQIQEDFQALPENLSEEHKNRWALTAIRDLNSELNTTDPEKRSQERLENAIRKAMYSDPDFEIPDEKAETGDEQPTTKTNWLTDDKQIESAVNRISKKYGVEIIINENGEFETPKGGRNLRARALAIQELQEARVKPSDNVNLEFYNEEAGKLDTSRDRDLLETLTEDQQEEVGRITNAGDRQTLLYEYAKQNPEGKKLVNTYEAEDILRDSTAEPASRIAAERVIESEGQFDVAAETARVLEAIQRLGLGTDNVKNPSNEFEADVIAKYGVEQEPAEPEQNADEYDIEDIEEFVESDEGNFALVNGKWYNDATKLPIEDPNLIKKLNSEIGNVPEQGTVIEREEGRSLIADGQGGWFYMNKDGTASKIRPRADVVAEAEARMEQQTEPDSEPESDVQFNNPNRTQLQRGNDKVVYEFDGTNWTANGKPVDETLNQALTDATTPTGRSAEVSLAGRSHTYLESVDGQWRHINTGKLAPPAVMSQINNPQTEPEPKTAPKPKTRAVPSDAVLEIIDRLKLTELAESVEVIGTAEIDEILRDIEDKENIQYLGDANNVKGFVYKNKVYLNADTLTMETPIHEFAHLYLSFLRKNHPELWRKGIEVVKQEIGKGEKSIISEIIDDLAETQPDLEGGALVDEILAQLIGEKGVDMLNKPSKGNPIVDWLKQAWEAIGKVLGLTNMSAQDLSNLDLDGFVTHSAADLLKGKALRSPTKKGKSSSSAVKFQKTKSISKKDFNKLIGAFKNVFPEYKERGKIIYGENALDKKLKSIGSSLSAFKKDGIKGAENLVSSSGKLYGAVFPDGTIWFDDTVINASTPIHEFTHVFNRMIQDANPELWDRIVEAAKNTKLWNEIQKDPNYKKQFSGKKGKDLTNSVANEIWAWVTGARGEQNKETILNQIRDNRTLWEKFQDTLNQFWEWVKSIFPRTGSTPLETFDGLQLMMKTQLKDDKVLYNLSTKYWNNLGKVVNDAKTIPELNEILNNFSDTIYDKYISKRAQISNKRARAQIGQIQLTNPAQMMAITARLGIQYKQDSLDYTEDEIIKLKKPAEDVLTENRKFVGNKWKKALENKTPAERYLVLRSLYQFISKESEAYPVNYLESAFDMTMEAFEQSSNPQNFNWYAEYNKNIIETLSDDPTSAVEVTPENGVHGTWIKMNKASESKNVEETLAKVNAASNNTGWCTRTTGAKKVIQEDDHDFYVFFPKNTTQAAIAIVPIKEGEESQLSSNVWYTGVFKLSNASDNSIEPDYYESVSELAKKTKDPDLAHTLEQIGFTGLTRGEVKAIKEEKDREKIDWYNSHTGDIFETDQDFTELLENFSVSLTRNGDEVYLHELTEGTIGSFPESIRAELTHKLLRSVDRIELDLDIADVDIPDAGRVKSVGGDLRTGQDQTIELDFVGGRATSNGNSIVTIGTIVDDAYSNDESTLTAETIGGSAHSSDQSTLTAETIKGSASVSGKSTLTAKTIEKSAYSGDQSTLTAETIKGLTYSSGESTLTAKTIGESAYSQDQSTLIAETIEGFTASYHESTLTAETIKESASSHNNSTLTAKTIKGFATSYNQSTLTAETIEESVDSRNNSTLTAKTIKGFVTSRDKSTLTAETIKGLTDSRGESTLIATTIERSVNSYDQSTLTAETIKESVTSHDNSTLTVETIKGFATSRDESTLTAETIEELTDSHGKSTLIATTIEESVTSHDQSTLTARTIKGFVTTYDQSTLTAETIERLADSHGESTIRTGETVERAPVFDSNVLFEMPEKYQENMNAVENISIGIPESLQQQEDSGGDLTTLANEALENKSVEELADTTIGEIFGINVPENKPRFQKTKPPKTLDEQIKEKKKEISNLEKILKDAPPGDIMPRFSMIGVEGAKNLSEYSDSGIIMDNLERAIDLESIGVDPKYIKERTGWERGVENIDLKNVREDELINYFIERGKVKKTLPYRNIGQRYEYNGKKDLTEREVISELIKNEKRIRIWKYEIIDGKFKNGVKDVFKNAEYDKKGYFLYSLIHAPRLFNAYPELAELGVRHVPEGGNGALGAYFRDGKYIELYGREPRLGTVIHEIQHYIQHKEGFAGGSNTQRSLFDLKTQIQHFKDLLEDAKALIEVKKQSGRKVERSDISRVDDLEYEYSRLLGLLTLENPYVPNDYNYLLYKISAGEMEAQMAAHRLYMDPDFVKNTLWNYVDRGKKKDLRNIIVNIRGQHFGLLESEHPVKFQLKKSKKELDDLNKKKALEDRKKRAQERAKKARNKKASEIDYSAITEKEAQIEKVLRDSKYFKGTPEKVDAQIRTYKTVLKHLAEAYAKRKGISIDDFYKNVLGEVVVKNSKVPGFKGNVTGDKLGRFVVTLIAGQSDVSTPLHEFAHIFEFVLSDAEKNKIAEWVKGSGAKWDGSDELREKFVEGYLAYIAAPRTKKHALNDEFKDFSNVIYKAINGVLDDQMVNGIHQYLTPEMEKLYSEMTKGMFPATTKKDFKDMYKSMDERRDKEEEQEKIFAQKYLNKILEKLQRDFPIKRNQDGSVKLQPYISDIELDARASRHEFVQDITGAVATAKQILYELAIGDRSPAAERILGATTPIDYRAFELAYVVLRNQIDSFQTDLDRPYRKEGGIVGKMLKINEEKKRGKRRFSPEELQAMESYEELSQLRTTEAEYIAVLKFLSSRSGQNLRISGLNPMSKESQVIAEYTARNGGVEPDEKTRKELIALHNKKWKVEEKIKSELNKEDRTIQEQEELEKEHIMRNVQSYVHIKDKIEELKKQRDNRSFFKKKIDQIKDQISKVKKGFNADSKIQSLLDKYETAYKDKDNAALYSAIKQLVAVVYADPTIPDPETFEQLHESVHQLDNRITQGELFSALLNSDPKKQKKAADDARRLKYLVQKEVNLLEELEAHVKESTLKDIPDKYERKYVTDQVNALQKYVDQINYMASLSDITGSGMVALQQKLDILAQLYTDLHIQEGDVNLTYDDIKNGIGQKAELVIEAIREVRKEHNKRNLENKLKGLEEVISELDAGTYQGDIAFMYFNSQQDVVDQMLSDPALKAQITGEKELESLIEAHQNNENINSVINALNTTLSRLNYKDIQTYEEIVAEIKKVLKQHGHGNISEAFILNAIYNRTKPSRIINEATEHAKLIRQQGQKLAKFVELLEENWQREAGMANGSKPQQTKAARKMAQLSQLIRDIGELSAIQYERSPMLEAYYKDLQASLSAMQALYNKHLTDPQSNIELDRVLDLARKSKAAKDIRRYERMREQAAADIQALKNKNKNNTWTSFDEFKALKAIPGFMVRSFSEETVELREKALADRRESRALLKNKALKIMKDRIKEEEKIFQAAKKKDPNVTIKSMSDQLQVLNYYRRLIENDTAREENNERLIRLMKENQEINAKLKQKYANIKRGPFGRGLTEFLNTPRLLTLAADLSFILYQGGMAIPWMLHPSNWKAARNLFANNVFGGLGNEIAGLVGKGDDSWYVKIEAKMKSHPRYAEAVESGLQLIDENTISLEDELNLQTLLERIPFIKKYASRLRKFSERMYISYMNQLRFDMYLYGRERLTIPNSDIDNAEAMETWAEHINTLTGSMRRFSSDESTNKSINDFVKGAAGIVISPRLYASNIKTSVRMMRDPFYLGYLRLRGRTIDKSEITNEEEYRKYAMQEAMRHHSLNALAYAGFVGAIGSLSLMTTYAALSGIDDEEERWEAAVNHTLAGTLNPFSTNFLKLQLGQRIYTFSPIAAYFRFTAKVMGSIGSELAPGLTGWLPYNEYDSMKFEEMIGDFLRYKANPVFGSLNTVLWNLDFKGDAVADTKLGQLGVGLTQFGLPISGQSVTENLRRELLNNDDPVIGVKRGLSLGFMEGIIDFTGVSSYTSNPWYDNSVSSYTRDKSFRLRYYIGKDYDNEHLKDTYTGVRIREQIQNDMGEYILNGIKNGRPPSKEQMSDHLKKVARDAFKKYDEEVPSTIQYKYGD